MFEYKWYSSVMSPFNRGESIWNRRCRAIEKELGNHCIKSDVSRHTLFDTDYYLVEVSDNKEHINDKRIADALDIPRDWVCLYQYRYNRNKWFAILEDELNDKYKDCNGELVFDDFDFSKALCQGTHCIEKRLKECDKCPDVTVNKHSNILTIQDYGWSSECVSNALGIPRDAVVDVSCDNNSITMIVLLDKVK